VSAWENRFEQKPLSPQTPAVFTLDDGSKIAGRVVSVKDGQVTFEPIGSRKLPEGASEDAVAMARSAIEPSRMTVPVEQADTSLAARSEMWQHLYQPVWEAQRKMYVEGIGDEPVPPSEAEARRQYREYAATTDKPLYVNEAVYGERPGSESSGSATPDFRLSTEAKNPEGETVQVPMIGTSSPAFKNLTEEDQNTLRGFQQEFDAVAEQFKLEDRN